MHTPKLFLLTKFFSILAIGQKFLELLPTLLFNSHRVGNKFSYAGLYITRANVSLFLIRDTLPTLNLPIKTTSQGSFFIWYNFSIRLWLQRREQ